MSGRASFVLCRAVAFLSLRARAPGRWMRPRAGSSGASRCGWSRAGCAANMEKGPQWAKTNLAADKLEQIRRLMDVDEQLIFRCSSRNPWSSCPRRRTPTLRPRQDATRRTRSASAKADTHRRPEEKPATAKAAAAPAKTRPQSQAEKRRQSRRRRPPKRRRRASKEPAKSAAAPAAKAAAGKPKPKAKADDAYKAPPPDPSANPFAGQPAPQ